MGHVKHFPLVSLPLFIQPGISSATNIGGAVSSKTIPDLCQPKQTLMNEVLQVAPAERRAALDLLREMLTRTNPAAPAMAQPDTPGRELELPGEIQAPGWLLLSPPKGRHKPPRDRAAAVQQSLWGTVPPLQSRVWSCCCRRALQDSAGLFPAGDSAPRVARALGVHCSCIMLCLE